MKSEESDVRACWERERFALATPCSRACKRAIDRRDRHAMRRGGRSSVDTVDNTPQWGLKGVSSSDYLLSALGGGEAGTANGFGFVQVFKLDKLPGVNSELFARNSGSGGWRAYISTTNQIVVRMYSGAAAAIANTGYQFTASDVGRIFVLIGQHTGSVVRAMCSKSVSTDVAITGYAHANVSTAAGVDSTILNPNSSCTLIAEATFTGTPTIAQLNDFADSVRTRGDIPDSCGPLYFATRNFSAANFFSTPNGLLGAASGFAIGVHFRPDVASLSTTGRFFGKSNGFSNGWRLYAINGVLQLNVFGTAGGAAEASSPGYTIPTADVGQMHYALFVHDGTKLRTYVKPPNGVAQEIGSGTAVAGYALPTGITQYLGRDFSGTTDASSMSVIGAVTGHVVPTTAQALAWLDASAAAGTVQAFTGAEHRYDLHADIVANGGTAVPAQALDRIGTDHLTRNGLAVVAGPNGIRGVGPYAGTDGWSSSAANALTGAAAGFHIVSDIVLTKMPSAQASICGNFPLGSASGYRIFFNGTGFVFALVTSGAKLSAVYVPTVADINKRLRIVANYTATGQLQLWVNGVQIGADVASGVTYLVPSPSFFQVGLHTNLQPFDCGTIETVEGGNFPLTPAEIVALSADLTNPAPATAGKTQKRYVFDTDIAAAAGQLPTKSVERISGNDDLLRLGGLTVAPVGMLINHRWSLKEELRGVTDPTGRRSYGAVGGVQTVNNSHYEHATGITGSASGYWGCWYGAVDTLFASTRVCAGKRGSGPQSGYAFGFNGSNVPFFEHHNGSAIPFVVGTAQAQADLGRMKVWHWLFTGSVLRLYCDGVQVGTDTATTGFLAAAGPYRIGRMNDSTFYATGTRWFGNAGGNTVPSAASIAAHANAIHTAGRMVDLPGFTQMLNDPTTDVVANGGALPATIADQSTGGFPLTRVGTLELAVNVATGPACPTQLTDRMTGAAVDALARVGMPQLVRIDPDIDGRKTYGGQGFSATNLMETAGGAAGSASGLWVSWYGVLPAASTGFGMLVGKRGVAVPSGYLLGSDGSGLYFEIISGGASKLLSTPLAVHLGRPHVFTGVYTGAEMRLYVDGVLYSTLAATGYTVPTAPYRIGSVEGVSAATTACWFGDAAGNGVPTLAQIQQHAADTLASGRMQSISGLTQTMHDPSQDVIASGNLTQLPAQVLDRVGTDHLTKVGISVVTTGSTRGVGPHSTADFWQTVNGGGIQGAATMHLATDLVFTKVPTTNEMIVHATNGSATSGWYLQAASNQLRFFTTGGGFSAAYTIAPGDVGQRLRVLVQRTADSGALRLIVNNAQVGSDVATQAFVPNAANTLPMVAGFFSGMPATSVIIESIQGGATLLSAGEIATLNADRTQPMPVIAGKTQKRYVLEQDIAAASGTLPGRSVERVSGNDDLTRAGSPLTLAQRAERLWSYETSPIFRGAGNISANTDNYSVAGGLAGDPAGFGFVWVGTIDSQAVSATRTLVSKRGTIANVGWELYTIGTNSAFQFTVGNASNIASTTTVSIAASDLGKVFIIGCWFDGAKVHIAARRVEVGTGATLTGAFVPDSGPFVVGKRNANDRPATSTTFLGFVGMSGYPSLAEYQALHDAILSREEIVSVPGREMILYDVTKDAVAAGGLPTTISDRAGSAHLTKNGTLTLALNYTRAAA